MDKATPPIYIIYKRHTLKLKKSTNGLKINGLLKEHTWTKSI